MQCRIDVLFHLLYSTCVIFEALVNLMTIDTEEDVITLLDVLILALLSIAYHAAKNKQQGNKDMRASVFHFESKNRRKGLKGPPKNAYLTFTSMDLRDFLRKCTQS